MKNTLLSYENISFQRDGKKILKEINWEIKKNENWVLLGLNGSGKTTLLAMLGAYTMPTSGRLEVFGHEFGKYPWEYVQKQLGYVSSNLNNFIATWAYDNIEKIVLSGKFASIGLYKSISDSDIEKANKIIETFELSYLKKRNTPFFKMSQGEKHRTLIARAMMADYKLLVLDEPCSGLDLRARELLLAAIEESSKSKPYIYVSHNIDEIPASASHVAILDKGLINFKGPKYDVLTDENLSRLYGLNIKLHWQNNRPFPIIS